MPLKTLATDWVAQPDPQKDGVKLELNRKLAMKFPGDRPDKTSVLFPHVPSTVVSIGDNQNAKSSRDIWTWRRTRNSAR